MSKVLFQGSRKLFQSAVMIVLFTGCSGLKVVNPEEEKDKDTKMLDFSSGKPQIVSTYSCRMHNMGKWVTALGKTEKEARAEVLAKCRDTTIISICEENKVTCKQN